ncbi:hypothetical protein AAC387_Pa12g2042 [Persea americana]
MAGPSEATEDRARAVHEEAGEARTHARTHDRFGSEQWLASERARVQNLKNGRWRARSPANSDADLYACGPFTNHKFSPKPSPAGVCYPALIRSTQFHPKTASDQKRRRREEEEEAKKKGVWWDRREEDCVKERRQ